MNLNAGNYSAIFTSAGMLVVRRVPIFVECTRNEHSFDAAWIEAAVAKAHQAAAEGYYPPLHVRHHEASTEANDAVQAAGYFKILGAETITFKGSPKRAVFADLVITDPDVQISVKQSRLPYRSVEIFDVDKPSIDSLALLDHEAPFLELPMLTIRTMDGEASAAFRTQRAFQLTPSDVAVRASFRRGSRAAILFREDYMADQQVDEKKKDEGKGENMEAAPMDVGAIVKAIESGTISVADMEAIVAAIAAQQGGEPEIEQPEPEESMADQQEDDKETPAPAAVPSGESMSAYAELRGQNEALAARIYEMEQAQTRAAEVAAALKRLDGKPLGSDLEARLISFHSEHGSKAFHAYVKAMDAAVGTVSTAAAASANFGAQSSRVPAVAMKYQSEGVEAVDRAAQFAREWEYLSKTGHTRIPQDRYVAVNMARTTTKN